MSDPYLTEWNPRDYLDQYYQTEHVAADELANFSFAARHLAGRRFARAVEVGCGPTLHHAMCLVPYVDQLFLADYLPANLAEVQLVLAGDPSAHDWSTYLGALTGGADPLPILRRVIAGLLPADVSQSKPVGDVPLFDLVASYYCIECSTGDRAEWRMRLANVAGLVAPGGALLLSALRKCHEYHVLDRTFPTTPIDETDFAVELASLGFDQTRTVIEAVSVAEWAGQGFDSICCVWAEKGPAPELR